MISTPIFLQVQPIYWNGKGYSPTKGTAILNVHKIIQISFDEETCSIFVMEILNPILISKEEGDAVWQFLNYHGYV